MPKINQEEYQILKGLNDRWKWIARDKDGEAFIYEYKPYRIATLWNFDDGVHDSFRYEDHFKFIKWEEEPYNITELIKEYEIEGYKKSAEIGWNEIRSHEERKRKESEEKKMKKGKEWLKEEITEILLTSKKDGTNYFYYRDLKEKIYNAINQLDETEVYEELEE